MSAILYKIKALEAILNSKKVKSLFYLYKMLKREVLALYD